MTSAEFKEKLQQELISEESDTVIESVTEDESYRTVIKFTKPITIDLTVWMQDRFKDGISTTSTDRNIIIINHPIKS